MNHETIMATLNQAIEKKSISQWEASMRATGNKYLLSNMRKQKGLPSLDSLQKLAAVLGLELYFGEPRSTAPAQLSWVGSAPHHGIAKCSVQGWGKDQPDLPALPLPDFINDPAAFYVTARGDSMRPEGINNGDHCLITPTQDIREGDRIWIKDKGGATAIKRLEEMTGKSLKLRGWMPREDGKQQSFDEERLSNYIDQAYPVAAVFRGRPGTDRAQFIPDPAHISFPFASPGAGSDYGVIALHDVQAAAGAGRLNWDEQVISSIAFPTPWLQANGISPGMASLIYVDGTSMEPTLLDGSVVMINHNRTTIRSRRMYAFTQNGDLRVKRLETLSSGELLVLSDNPNFPSEIIREDNGYDFRVIGEVVWTASTLPTSPKLA